MAEATNAYLVMIKRVSYEYRVIHKAAADDEAVSMAANQEGTVVQAPWRYTTEYKAKKIPSALVQKVLDGTKHIARPPVRKSTKPKPRPRKPLIR